MPITLTDSQIKVVRSVLRLKGAGLTQAQFNSFIRAAPRLLDRLDWLMQRGAVQNSLEDDEREEILELLAKARGQS